MAADRSCSSSPAANGSAPRSAPSNKASPNGSAVAPMNLDLGAPSIRALCEWVGNHEPQPASVPSDLNPQQIYASATPARSDQSATPTPPLLRRPPAQQ